MKTKKRIFIILIICVLVTSFLWDGKSNDTSNAVETQQEISDIMPEVHTEITDEETILKSENIQKEVEEQASASNSVVAEVSIENSEPIENKKLIEKKETLEHKESTEDKEKVNLSELDEELNLTITISSKTILDNLDKFDENKVDLLSIDGIIYEAQTTFEEGDTVFDVLQREMQNNKIHFEFTKTPIKNNVYIEGINNIYEFDCGELSGWMYKVNGEFPNYSSSQYELKDNDVVEWLYSCDLGRDIGNVIENGGNGQ